MAWTWRELERAALRGARHGWVVPPPGPPSLRQQQAEQEVARRLGPHLVTGVAVRESTLVPPGDALLVRDLDGGYVLLVRHLSDVYLLKGWRAAARWTWQRLQRLPLHHAHRVLRRRREAD